MAWSYAFIQYDGMDVCRCMDGGTATWTDPAYRTITLAEPATGEFLEWLQKYAVKQ